MVSLPRAKQVANNIIQKYEKNTLKDTAPDIKLNICFYTIINNSYIFSKKH